MSYLVNNTHITLNPGQCMILNLREEVLLRFQR